MDQIGPVTGLDAETLLVGREADRESLRQAARSAGSPEAYIRATYPTLGTTCPPGMSEPALVAETRDWYAESEARLVLCRACPPQGAACAGVTSLLRPGQLPVWDGDRVVAARCDRYREWRLCQRLAISNVPERYRSVVFKPPDESRPLVRGFRAEDPWQRAARKAVIGFSETLRSGGSPWLVLHGPHETGKTHLACALLRNLPTMMPRTRFWYADMNELRIAMKSYKFDSNDADPMERLRATDVLVLDNLDTAKLAKEAWLHERVEDLLYQRWNRSRATLLTTHGDLSDLVGEFPAITTLREAPSCRLA